jgi:hypothetical protein
MTATESLLPEIINDFFNKICHLRTHATAKRRARVAMILLWQVLWADLNCSNKVDICQQRRQPLVISVM